MGSRIFLVGSGGREHALGWKLAQSPLVDLVIAAPGNPGLESLPKVTCVPVQAEAVPELVAAAVAEKADLVVCGPESALAAGLGDAMRAAGLAFFGPSRAAAEIESSKAYAKKLMARAGVPTAAFGAFDDVAGAEAYIDAQEEAPVVKADGLAAGKGVVVAGSKAEAKAAVRRMLAERAFGAAGARVVLEQRLRGREVSMMALCDGTRLVMLASAEDHKAVGDGDFGPNTGGMGAYSPSPLVDEALAQRILETVFVPTVRALAQDGRPFSGLLYGGLMLTERGPMVIEWNCRFGDPETQAVLVRMEDDLFPWLAGVAAGVLPAGTPRWRPGASVCVVLAADGYPIKARAGDAIDLHQLPVADGAPIAFHAGTGRDGEGRLVTAGGRVLGITARGADLAAARAAAYGAIEKVRFEGMHYRRDIGMRGER